MLKVRVLSASDLPDVDITGKSDPFVVLCFRGREAKTVVKDNTLNPKWEDALFEWKLENAPLEYDDKLSVKVNDYNVGWFKELLGKVDIPLGELRQNPKIEGRSYDLLNKKNMAIQGKVKLGLEYIPADTSREKTEQGDFDSESDDDDFTDDEKDLRKKTKLGKKAKKGKRRQRTRVARQWSDKKKDFQIRVWILEGRALPGTNIHPVVRVTVGGQRQETQVKKSTNRPVYNELLSFSFQTSEAELFNNLIFLEVFNSRGFLRSNALLGYFKCDIGSVYERKGHSFVRKWVMLTSPTGELEQVYGDYGGKHSRNGRAPAGYLKVTAVVLGTGDKPPVGIDILRSEDKDEDIDTNCLTPIDIPRQSAVFELKVYQANDLPRMDAGVIMTFRRFFKFFSRSKETEKEDYEGGSDPQNLVDPFLIFSFAGKEIKTDVKYNDSNPKFNQVLKLPFMFPTMCEKLKLQLMDWDQGNANDFIGTAYLSLSSMSDLGNPNEDFLPQFGPCFLNFYGSPREYHKTRDKYEHLNKGIGEGVAYRGRLLIELKTSHIDHMGSPVCHSMAQEDVLVEPFMKQLDYTLFACFHEATMVTVHHGPIEFEVSMGINGTKFDETVAPSNTSPCNAVYDGLRYHYLPWGRDKPCVWVDGSWEDIAFRIEPMNALNNMRAKLKKGLNEVQRRTRELSSVLEEFVDSLRKQQEYFQDRLPKMPGKRNTLDDHIYKLRLKELENLTEEASELRREKDIAKALEVMKSFISRIKSMAVEPQQSIPDVVVWMISGDKRVAYHRIPAHDLLFSETDQTRGKFCGKTMDLKLKYPGRQPRKHHPEILALVRLELWLGLVKYRHYWTNREGTEGEFKVFAETYENEKKKAKSGGKSYWVPLSSETWPNFSDYAGNLELPKNDFHEPQGWKFATEKWKNACGDLMMHRQHDRHLQTFTDVVYEHEIRSILGGSWQARQPRFTDADGADLTTLPTSPPTGWQWTMDKWIVDPNRAVDQEGWEYSAHNSYEETTPKQKANHFYRKRKLNRNRGRLPSAGDKEPETTEGWEYARGFHETFHPKESPLDCVRRKWLLKEIVPRSGKFDGKSDRFPVFDVSVTGQKKKKSYLRVLPRMFVTFQSPHKYQLWVSVYQARGLVAQDKSGANDPYVLVTFTSQSQRTKTLTQTLSPTWDQTLIFTEVEIFEDPETLKENPPSVVMEIFDQDKERHDFLGRCIVTPKVQLTQDQPLKAKLAWYKIRRGEEDGGQLLAECELFLNEGDARLPTLPPTITGKEHPVRPGVRPKTRKKAIEVLCWGLRNMKSNLSIVALKPSVEFECNQTIIGRSDVIRDMKRCPNFTNPLLQGVIMDLPKDDIYAPPINIRVFHNGILDKIPMGVHVVRSLSEFEIHPATTLPRQGRETNKKKWIKPVLKEEDKEQFDWWSKYDASQAIKAVSSEMNWSESKEDFNEHVNRYLMEGYDTLEIYPSKLEDVFEGFNDFVATFPLRKGKTKSSWDYDKEVGQLKGSFRICPVGEDSVRSAETMHMPSREPIECVVRVYIIRARNLQPKDSDGLADPYLIVSLNKTYNESDKYIAKTLDPIFGRVFEFKAKIPLVKDLKIAVMDHDPDFDDVIGKTVIDLEQRLLSRYRATCGLPKTYFISGPCKWRETLKPLQLLVKHCNLTGKKLRLETGSHGNPDFIYVGDKPYSLNQFEEGTPPDPRAVGRPLERLALHVLHTCGLVPEHVETRPLYNEVQPEIEQGRLEMWVDLFPKEDKLFQSLPSASPSFVTVDGLPIYSHSLDADTVDFAQLHSIDPLQAPIRIDPRQPLKYQLRVVIWSTTDVLLDDKNFAGEEMSDIFVKAWIDGIDKTQETSVHERSFDGNGSFNWRMVFDFLYLPIEKKIVVREKTHFMSFHVREQRLPPIFKVQICDKDRLTWSDFLGQEQLNLAKLTRPCIHPSHCFTNKDPAIQGRRSKQTVDLFSLKEISGWWACYNKKLQRKPTGKVHMTLKIVTEEEAVTNPVGLGQNEPNQHPVLPKPIRPSTSFLWYLAPLRTFRHIIWKNSKATVMKLLLAILLVLLIACFVYSVPGYTVKKVLGV